MKRREFLIGAVAFSGASRAFGAPSRQRDSSVNKGSTEIKDGAVDIEEEEVRSYLRSIMPTAQRVEQFTHVWTAEESRRLGNGWTYDAELGWVHSSAIQSNGVDDSKTFYHYAADGARKVVNFPGKPCRIHAYGNSFTHCDQVNDNETWEEYLAAHLQEPVRNYGVGGYGVYQAYRRMLKVERNNPAEYILLNIWDDDHYRSLDAWRSIRFGQGSSCGFTLPHVRVNLENDRCEQRENLLRTSRDVSKLRDETFVFQAFKDDPVLQLVLAARSGDAHANRLAQPVAVSFGIPAEKSADSDLAQRVKQIHTEAALFATRHILTWTEEFAAKTGKKLLLILSFGRRNMAHALQGDPQFDQTLTDWLRTKPYPVIDMRDVFARQYRTYRGDARSFLKPYYNGHHTPAGNFLSAWAIKSAVVEWLDPPPLPYR